MTADGVMVSWSSWAQMARRPMQGLVALISLIQMAGVRLNSNSVTATVTVVSKSCVLCCRPWFSIRPSVDNTKYDCDTRRIMATIIVESRIAAE